jgi:hypothetical protein
VRLQIAHANRCCLPLFMDGAFQLAAWPGLSAGGAGTM